METLIKTRQGRLIVAAGLVAVGIAGCGPNAATIKRYVVASPRRTIALMPFAVAAGQKDLRRANANSIRNKLIEYGFQLASPNKPGVPFPPPPLSLPGPDEIRAYAALCRTDTVLIGRIEKATDRVAKKGAVYRNDPAWMQDSTGKTVRMTVRTEVSPERPERSADFLITLKLVDAPTGNILWFSTPGDSVPNWALSDVARYTVEGAASDLAQTYLAKKF